MLEYASIRGNQVLARSNKLILSSHIDEGAMDATERNGVSLTRDTLIPRDG